MRFGEAVNQQRFQFVLTAFVLSMAMLAYEILLTRIASVLLTSQYVFLILGAALLGVSAGAIVEYWLAKPLEQTAEATPGVWLSWCAGILVLAILFVLKLGAQGSLLTLSLSAALPFAVSGLVLSRLFRLSMAMTGVLYSADLTGAAAGALAVPVLLPSLGPVQAILVLALALAAAGAFVTFARFRIVPASAALILLAAVAGLLYGNRNNALLGEVPIADNSDKDLYRLGTMLSSSAEIIESRWSTFGRTDLVRFNNDPSTMAIFIDGAAGANMLRFDGRSGDSSAALAQATRDFPGMAPLCNLKEDQRDSALIIGPGGGRDVLLALEAGFKSITAVEINPQMVQIVKDYRNFNGGIYTDFKNVRVVVAEGRDFLRHSDQQYDLIMLFMPVTKSSRGLNAFALSESYLFTQEAFGDYHRHLTNEGSLLIMAHGMPEVLKFATTALTMLEREGMAVEQAMPHLYILGSEMMPLFGMRKVPLLPEESEDLHAAVHSGSFDSRYSYLPGVEQKLLRLPLPTSIDAGVPMMNPFLIDLAEGKLPLSSLVSGAGINLRPSTDDRPFFFQFDFGIPEVVSTVWWLAMAVLATVFVVPAYGFRLLLPPEARRLTWAAPLFFTAIGIGYIVVELALFQKLVFYLGDPSRTLALLLAALLVGSGMGSFISRRSSGKVAVFGGALSGATIIFILIGLPLLFSVLHNAAPAVRQTAAALVLFFQGIPMGLMFPIGLRVVEHRLGTSAIPWMWAVNGASSVAGSSLAIMVAMIAGYSWSLVLAALCYIAAALLIHHLRDATLEGGSK